MKLPSPLIPSKSNTAIPPSSSSSVFPKFLHRPTPAQLNAASRTKNASHVAQIPARIITTGVCPNQFTFSAVLPACAETAVSAHGEQVHCLVIRHGFGRDVFVGSALVDMYAKRSRADAVEKVFDEMSERNPVTCSSIVLGLLQNGFSDRAVLVFRRFFGEILSRRMK
ncbi:putative pentatricopeptide repeat-containing protein At3g13770, mitochondrial [Eucalyptus grandis]|uniref:putative pentatricopeptide repeat-containing protein At3g13770, mitochondrial n=1 Tax=Eucalyptus grandis TaxID=71139 RepID=UPI00192EC251|nr:putative pentatricopeptide repeat-containing protein At3g13770, mitochondrial [Eucalyptus grandis]